MALQNRPIMILLNKKHFGDEGMNQKEIAQLLGVSQSTVSMVLHDKKGVGDAMKEKIRALLKENGYDVVRKKAPVAAPKQAKIMFIKYKRSSLMIDGNPEYITALMDEVGLSCNRNGYELVFQVATSETLLSTFQKANVEQYEGIILLGTEFSNADRSLLDEVRKPIVIIDNDLVKLPVTSVSVHTWNSMRRKVEYLVGKGHTRIGYIRNSNGTSICEECFRGFKNAMEEQHLPVCDEYIYCVSPTFDGAYASMKKLLKQGVSIPSALISNTDCLSLGVMKAMQEYGIRVPENVSIIGGDNITSCTMYSPQLTTCDVHVNDIGKWAVKLLQDQIENPAAPVIRLRVESMIVERESVCDFEHYIPFEG